jgi:glutamine cyclotransferase
MNKYLIFSILSLIFTACNSGPEGSGAGTPSAPSNDPPALNFTVLNIFPHDTTAYTEGFLVHEGQVFESTGHTDSYPSSQSLFGVLDLKSGKIQTKVHLDNEKYFGEGICFLKGKVYQLTLDEKVCFVYDAKTFKQVAQYPLNSEGWGLTTDGTNLIRSDGSSNLYYYDPANFKLLKILGVSDNNGPRNNINELEWIEGYIYANIWQTNYIVKIDPSSGKIVGRADFTQLNEEAKHKYPGSDTMNGIAYDSATKKIYITGKMWPNIYEIKFNNP